MKSSARRKSANHLIHCARKAAELREMIREAAAGMAAAGMDEHDRIPWWHVERRRIWARFPDRRTLTGIICGDPIHERSALGERMAA